MKFFVLKMRKTIVRTMFINFTVTKLKKIVHTVSGNRSKLLLLLPTKAAKSIICKRLRPERTVDHRLNQMFETLRHWAHEHHLAQSFVLFLESLFFKYLSEFVTSW